MELMKHLMNDLKRERLPRRLSLVSNIGWVLYEEHYVTFGRFDEDGDSSERLSHWVRWAYERYPETEEDLLTIIRRIVDAMESPER